MKKLILFLVAVVSALTIEAAYPYFVFRCKDGTEKYVKSEGMKIEISDNSLTVTHAEGNTVFNLSDLTSMAFSETSAGIDSPVADRVESFEVFTVSGVSMGRYNSVETFRKSVTAPGVYVLKYPSVTEKIIIGK